jgi:hypothetical protein
MPASPWPNQPCPYADCGRLIKDLLAEMVPDKDQARPEFKAVVTQGQGGAVTCPYCQKAVEYEWMEKRWALRHANPFDIREPRWKREPVTTEVKRTRPNHK